MPRIEYVTNLDYIAGKQNHSPENEAIDVCRDCWDDYDLQDIELARTVHQLEIPADLPEDFISIDSVHPDYNDDDFMYRCRICRCKLRSPRDD